MMGSLGNLVCEEDLAVPLKLLICMLTLKSLPV